MNRKQLIAAWVTGIVVCLVWAMWWFDPLTTTPRCLLVSHIVTLIIGGLSIYSLRDEKK